MPTEPRLRVSRRWRCAENQTYRTELVMRKFIFFLIAAMSSWLILYAVPSGADDAKRTLHGTVTYHERIALQANAYAIVEARSKDGKVDAEQAVRVRIGALPASFEGELPCTDCPAIRYHLDLFPDRLYFLRTKYEGTQRQLDTVGTWMGNPSGSLLTLQSERRSGLTFEIMDTATLLWPPRRMASSAYWPRTSYVLKRTSSFQPVEPRATLTGIYRHVAGSGVLEICAGLSQSRLPVAQEGANAALEAAYVHLVPAARGDVLAQFEGRIAMQPKPEGEGLQPTLIVERVIELKPGETCKTHLTAIQLEDTPWTLTHLGDGAVPSGYDPDCVKTQKNNSAILPLSNIPLL
jgi:hypothetical protein